MAISLFKNPISKFLFLLLSFYIGWYFLYTFLIHPYQKIDLFIIDISIDCSKWILELFGYKTFTGADRLIGIDGTGGLWVGDNCNGIALFALFSGFIIAYKGKIKQKIVFITIGIIMIEFLNILRIVILAIIDTHSRTWTEFNHTYTFTILIYGFIFLLWMKWVNKMTEKKLQNKNEI